jgi:hypothetical protein
VTPLLVGGFEWAPAAQSWSPSHCCTEVRLTSAVGTGSIGNVCIRPHHSGITQCYSTAYGRTRQRTLRAHSAGLPGGAVRLGSQLAGLKSDTETTSSSPQQSSTRAIHRQPEPECITKLGQGRTANLTTPSHRQRRPRSPPPRFAGWLQGNTHTPHAVMMMHTQRLSSNLHTHVV